MVSAKGLSHTYTCIHSPPIRPYLMPPPSPQHPSGHFYWMMQTPTFICFCITGIAFSCWFLSEHFYLNIMHSPHLNSQKSLMNNAVMCINICFSQRTVMKHSSIILSQCYYYYFNFLIDFLNWNFIFLQYCIGFAMYWHESTTGVHEFPTLNPPPPPSPYHLSGSSQCISPKHSVSCIEPRLAIQFLHDSIHVSMPFSQIIPPSPSPTESQSLFFISASLLVSHI